MVTTQDRRHQHHLKVDVAGQLLSTVCAVHCIATPLVLGLIPAATPFMGNAHPVLLAFVIAIALWAFIPGYRCHRQGHVVGLAMAGIALLAVGAIFFHDNLQVDTGLSLMGAMLMMGAHWRNRRMLQRAHGSPASG